MRITKRMRRRRALGFHGISLIITALFLLYGFTVARWSWVRAGQELISTVFSVLFYLSFVIGLKDTVSPRVLDVPDIPFAPLLPLEREALREAMPLFWDKLFDSQHFLSYLASLSDGAQLLSRLLLPVLCIGVFFYIKISGAADKECMAPGRESRPLRAFKWTIDRLRKPAGLVRSYCLTVRRSRWWKLWILIWLVNLNVITVCLAILAYYFYFSVSFDVVHLYLQIYKLLLDVSVAGAALHWFGWLVIAYVLYGKIRTHFAYERLKKQECRNAAFADSLPIFALITGKVGTNKTKMLTDMGLTVQDTFRSRQLRMMRQIESEFPFFPWNDYRLEIKRAFIFRRIRSLASAKDFARTKADRFRLHGCSELQLFGYDLTRYPFYFDNGIVRISIIDRIADYAQLMYLYFLQSLMSGNYSIRLEDALVDKGNLPLWSNDYFKCPSVERELDYRHCYRLNFDTLRLGLTVDPESDASGAFEVGVIMHTEMGKDFGNKETNSDFKRTDSRCNPKNDMLIDHNKIARHSSTVCHFPYFRYLGDEQRPETVGADMRELMAVIRIKESSEDLCAKHMFLFESFVYDVAKAIWNGWFVRFNHNRSDETLLSFLCRHFVGAVHKWYTVQTARFMFNVQTVLVEDGTLDGDRKENVYFLSHKKIHADRYATDCYADIFETRARESSWSLPDAPTFRGNVATSDEILATNSYFGARLLKIKQKKRGPSADEKSAAGDGARSVPGGARRR